MGTERPKCGPIAQAVIAAVGGIAGAVFGLELAPLDIGVGPLGPTDYALLRWGYAACGATVGGLLFSWAKDR
jgi:hypothetical protein